MSDNTRNSLQTMCRVSNKNRLLLWRYDPMHVITTSRVAHNRESEEHNDNYKRLKPRSPKLEKHSVLLRISTTLQMQMLNRNWVNYMQQPNRHSSNSNCFSLSWTSLVLRTSSRPTSLGCSAKSQT